MKKFLFLVLLLTLVAPVQAQNRWVEGSQSTAISSLMLDESRNLIYAADSGNGEVLVIDPASEAIADSYLVGSPIEDLALRGDGRFLDVAANGGLKRIDLRRGRVKSLSLPSAVKGAVISIAYSHGGAIVLATDEGYNRGMLYILAGNLKKIKSTFGVYPTLSLAAYNALIKTSRDGNTLYVVERGLSPTSMYAIDISNQGQPSFIAEDAHGSLGGNARDFALDDSRGLVYLACGSPYAIQVINGSTIAPVTSMSTGPYLEAVTYSAAADSVVATTTSNSNEKVYAFDAETGIQLNSVALDEHIYNGRPIQRGLAVDANGTKAFVVHGDEYAGNVQIQVVEL